jgi:hypothetical protein
MFSRDKKVANIGRDNSSPEVGRVFQVPYGKISKIALSIRPDRVIRNLFLYDPRSNDPDAFIRIRLPDGGLPEPEEDCLPQHREGVIIQWAREDADAYLDGQPLQHLHREAAQDDASGQLVKVKATTACNIERPAPTPAPQPAPRPAPAAEPRPAPQERPAQNSEPPAPEDETDIPQTPRELTEQPLEESTGVVAFVGVRAHSYQGRSYDSYTVDIITDSGTMDTYRGTQLEDLVRSQRIKSGDTITLKKLPKKEGSKKNRFYLVKR